MIKHVHVVLEIPIYDSDDPIIHGVFAKRELAEDKAKKLVTRHFRLGHIAVLKQRLRGA